MADFVHKMKDWRRMCKYYSDESMKDGQHSCADMCPLGSNTACGDIETTMDRDIEDMAKKIAKWAAEHPEPVYPSWYAWLANMGVVPIELPPDQAVIVIDIGLLKKIPADIAQKLGIEPKEG